MTEKPYTDEDLRAEAARQLADAELPDLETVSEQMRNADIASRSHWSRDAWWHSLPNADQEVALSSVHGLIEGAADVSEWAVNLGADGLEPDDHTLQLGASDSAESEDQPRVRMHFAFHPDMTAADRDSFVVELSKVVLRNL